MIVRSIDGDDTYFAGRYDALYRRPQEERLEHFSRTRAMVDGVKPKLQVAKKSLERRNRDQDEDGKWSEEWVSGNWYNMLQGDELQQRPELDRAG